MRTVTRNLLLTGLFALLLWLSASDVRAEDRRLLQARVLVGNLAAELKGELRQALREQGLVGALTVCREVAPALAEKYSQSAGVTVRRVSLRRRNPANQADEWELQGLESFAQRRQRGEPLAGMEEHETVEKDGVRQFRYLRAVPTGALCLKCHGENLNLKLKEALRKYYPGDQAVDFRLGELRGAFSVVLPQ